MMMMNLRFRLDCMALKDSMITLFVICDHSNLLSGIFPEVDCFGSRTNYSFERWAGHISIAATTYRHKRTSGIHVDPLHLINSDPGHWPDHS